MYRDTSLQVSPGKARRPGYQSRRRVATVAKIGPGSTTCCIVSGFDLFRKKTGGGIPPAQCGAGNAAPGGIGAQRSSPFPPMRQRPPKWESSLFQRRLSALSSSSHRKIIRLDHRHQNGAGCGVKGGGRDNSATTLAGKNLPSSAALLMLTPGVALALDEATTENPRAQPPQRRWGGLVTNREQPRQPQTTRAKQHRTPGSVGRLAPSMPLLAQREGAAAVTIGKQFPPLPPAGLLRRAGKPSRHAGAALPPAPVRGGPGCCFLPLQWSFHYGKLEQTFGSSLARRVKSVGPGPPRPPSERGVFMQTSHRRPARGETASAAEMLRTAATALWDAAALLDAQAFANASRIFQPRPESAKSAPCCAPRLGGAADGNS